MAQQKPYQQMLKWAQERPNEIFLRQIISRQFCDFSYFDVVDQALRIVTALRAQGLEPGDKIALISKNCAQWIIADLAMMLGSYISVPIFPTASADSISFILEHSESKALFVGKLDDITPLTSALSTQKNMLTIAFPYPNMDCQYRWKEWLVQYQPAAVSPCHKDSDLMSIVYTSGTSGLPKGAMLSYGGDSWSVQHILECLEMQQGERLFSYLPLAHITERVYIMGSAMMAGICTAFPESLDTFIDDVKMHRPTLFISVPRLWSLFQQRIQKKLPDLKLNILLKIPFISGLIKRKIAANLGLDQARVLGCGSAPVSTTLLRWYERIGLNITEAWGMTESFAFSTINHPFRSDKIGTVGKVAPGIEIKLAANDEIVVNSPGLFLGYYKNDKATAKTLINGWLQTGDIGRIDSDGYLFILGRINDTFKTAKGKFVSPVPIEKRLYELTKIEMLCVIGSGMAGPMLLMLPETFVDFNRERYEKRITWLINTVNDNVESHQKIRGALMIKTPWSVENGILTPTLKIQRYKLEKKYKNISAQWPSGVLIQWEE